MKEKTADIDILEELKEWFNNFDLDSIKHKPEEYIQAISNLIAENKELKSEIQHKNDQMLLQDREIDKHYILKTEIENKINELENIKLCSDEFFKSITVNKIKLLQSLLEKE